MYQHLLFLSQFILYRFSLTYVVTFPFHLLHPRGSLRNKLLSIPVISGPVGQTATDLTG
jgi:hypothetical protein